MGSKEQGDHVDTWVLRNEEIMCTHGFKGTRRSCGHMGSKKRGDHVDTWVLRNEEIMWTHGF